MPHSSLLSSVSRLLPDDCLPASAVFTSIFATLPIAEPGPGGWHSACQGRQASSRAPRELAQRRTSERLAPFSKRRITNRQTGSCHFSHYCSGAGCGARKPLSSPWNIFSAGTITGPSSICSEKVAIFDPCPFRTGSRVSSITGLLRLKSNPGRYFVA